MIHRRASKITKTSDLWGESQSFFNFWFSWANHFIIDSDSFRFTIHYDFRFKVILWILIRFWFVANRDTSANHYSPANLNWIESKIKGRWIVINSFANHWLIRFQLKSELKWIANHAGPSPGISILLNNSFFFPYWRDFFLISKKSGPFKILQVFKGSSVGTSEIIFNRIILNRFSTFRNAMIT